MPREDQATTAALFLAGKGDLTRDFTARAVPPPPGAPAGSAALELTPRHEQRDYDTLTLVTDPATHVIRMLVAADRQGGRSVFAFDNIKENTGLADNVFQLLDTPWSGCHPDRRSARLTHGCTPFSDSDPRDCGARRRDVGVCAFGRDARRPRGGEARRLRPGSRRIHESHPRGAVEQGRPARAESREAARVGGALPARPPARRQFQFEEALLEYQLAAELNPSDADVERELTATRNALRAKVSVASQGRTALEALIDRTREMSPTGRSFLKTSSWPTRWCSATPARATCSRRSPASPTSTSSSIPGSAIRRSQSICATSRSATPWQPSPRARGHSTG